MSRVIHLRGSDITINFPNSEEVHWACGKVECDCDELTDQLLDLEREERDYESDCY